ncbi:MAG TPA: helix-turn-helix domain-containing protein [Solirubrobacterales bacterium]|nr:helix-turn-helix domain-containing protein [Solirubrobacterales bacterium]
METGVGASLREARKRRELDLTEVEAAIKIRVRYLQAIEDEDWDVLPGDVYARGFVRTYASYLGLDGERLAEEYREGVGGAVEERAPRRLEPVGSAVPPARRGRRLRGRALTALVVLALGGLLVAVGVLGGDEDGGPAAGGATTKSARPVGSAPAAAAAPRVALALRASEEVWVCLLDAEREALVDGEILVPGEEAGPFRSRRFSAAFGNGAVELRIDGRPARTPASSGPVGYEVDAEGGVTSLAEGERPECE